MTVTQIIKTTTIWQTSQVTVARHDKNEMHESRTLFKGPKE